MLHSKPSWWESSVLETTNAEEGKQDKQKNAMCGDSDAGRASEPLAFLPQWKIDNEWPLWDFLVIV